jgi:hypothetical protein
MRQEEGWKRLPNGSCMFALLLKHYSGNRIKKMRLAGHVECRGRGEVHTGSWWGKLRKEDYLEDPGVCERILLKCIFKK